MKKARVIDVHTHSYGESASEDPRGFARRFEEPHWEALVAPKGRVSLQAWASPQKMVTQMDEAGVRCSVLLGWYWQGARACEWQNQWMARVKKDFPGRFEAFAAIHPPSVEACREQLHGAIENGFRGIGEIHPAVQGFRLTDDCWLEVVEFALEHDLLINLHITEPVGRPYLPREETPFRDIQWLIEKYPDLKLILAHWGGLVCMHELNPYIREKWKNVFYDTSASPLLYDPEVFKTAIGAAGAHKFLFGSDYPLRLYPREQKGPDFSRFLSETMAVLGDPAVVEKVCWQNAEKLFGLNGEDA